MEITTSTHRYQLDDWLVIRTNNDGHQAVVVTELWPEWRYADFEHMDSEKTQAALRRVMDRALALPESAWHMSCSNGWCGKCEGWNSFNDEGPGA